MSNVFLYIYVGRYRLNGFLELWELRCGMWKDVRLRKYYDFSNFYVVVFDVFIKFKRE